MKIDPANLGWKDAHELLVGAVVPRPIAFVSTVGEDGVFNVAPFSFFAGVSVKPMLVGVSFGTRRDGSKKDTLVNIEFSKDFVVGVVTEELAEAMNQSSADYPIDVDEFQEVGLTPAKSDLVKSPMIAESPVTWSAGWCKSWSLVRLPESIPLSLGKWFGFILKMNCGLLIV